MPEALYEMFLLYSRWGRTEEARTIRDRLAADFPDHDLTKMVTDPDFEWNARYGREIEDSLYAAFYTLIPAFDFRSMTRPGPPIIPLSSKISPEHRDLPELFPIYLHRLTNKIRNYIR